MAVIHISEAEAARDLPGLLAKVRAGREVRINSDLGIFAIVDERQSPNARPRMASDLLAALERDGSKATLDTGFAEDVEVGIGSRELERLIDPWESF